MASINHTLVSNTPYETADKFSIRFGTEDYETFVDLRDFLSEQSGRSVKIEEQLTGCARVIWGFFKFVAIILVVFFIIAYVIWG